MKQKEEEKVVISKVDFTKKIKNSNKFRQAAIQYINTGSYCQYPTNTTEYFKFWDEETKRCIDGYTAPDGDYITGYHYFYINYCPILRIVNKIIEDKQGNIRVKRISELTFPDFYDYDYYYFQAIQEAEELGKHICLIKSRRKGFSYKGGSMACRNFYLIPASKSYIYASNKQYLTEDGIITKAWEYMDFIDKNTAWAKKRQVTNTQLHRKASMIVTDEYGNRIETGYKSEIIGVSLKDNPHALRGKRAKLILFEEGGTFSELATAWQVARPSVEQDGVTFGLMIVWGTGGDTGSKFEPLKKMFYKPAGYNCLGFKNIWDEGYPDQPCGFFVPQYTNMDVRDDDGNRLYMDEDGNTKVRESTEYILQERREMISNAVSAVEIDRFVAERPITPAEAMLEFNGNIFPKKELMAHLNNIRTHKNLQNHKQIGDLVFDSSGQLQWIPKKHGDITKYPLEKNDDPTGSIVIWEHPVRDASVGLYIAGIDSYDYDQSSSSTSLGSCLIYKRFQNFEQYYDIIVAEYTGRPETAEQFYENVRKLLLYYNARAMYENQNKGLFVYFTNKHCDYLLADQPDIINDIVGDSKVQRKKGCHMNAQIKQWGEGMIKDWLNEEQSPGKKNLHNILSEPLLEELISYSDTANTDRVMALMQIMIYKEQLYNVVVKKKEKENKNRMLFDGPIFAQSWFNEVTPSIFNDSNTYTF